MGKSRPSGRVGNERLITDFLGRIRFSQLPYTAYSVAVCGLLVAIYGSFGRVGIRIGGKEGMLFKAVLQVYQNEYVKIQQNLQASTRAHPPSRNFFVLPRRSAGAVQLYARLYIYSNSLLAQSRWNANSCILGSRAPPRGGAEINFIKSSCLYC